MRSATQSAVCLGMAIWLTACGGGGSSKPTPVPQSLTITPGTTILRATQTETFTGSLTMSDGQTQSVQPTWQSDATTVLTFETGGTARGLNNGLATIIATHQGLQATRLMRVATNYQGSWIGDYVVRRCESSGDIREGQFCDREDGFYVGEILSVGFELRQDRDAVTGDMVLGSIEGITSGSVAENGRYVGTGSLTFTAEGTPVVFAINPLNVNAEGDRLVGRFTVTVTVTGFSGQGILDAELATVVRTSSGILTSAGHSRSFSSLKELFRSMRR